MKKVNHVEYKFKVNHNKSRKSVCTKYRFKLTTTSTIQELHTLHTDWVIRCTEHTIKGFCEYVTRFSKGVCIPFTPKKHTMLLESTETTNPIEYDWFVDGPQGAKFILHPVKGKHTPQDVSEAKTWLRRNHDVVSIHVEQVNERLTVGKETN